MSYENSSAVGWPLWGALLLIIPIAFVVGAPITVSKRFDDVSVKAGAATEIQGLRRRRRLRDVGDLRTR